MNMSARIMPPHPSQRLTEQYAARAARLAEAVGVMAGPESPLHLDALALVSVSVQEWERIASNRGLSLPTVAFVGERNSGKTTLAGLLIDHSRVGMEMPAGEAEAAKTKRLLWVGPQRPPNLSEQFERHWRVDAANMADLGEPYMILDVPGTGDVDSRLQDMADAALSSARYKVLVIDAGTIEAESPARYMSLGDGSVILPAVRLRAGQTRELLDDEHGLHERIERGLDALRAALPRSTVLPGLLLPDLDSLGDADAAGQEVRRRLRKGLQTMFASHREQAEGRIQELAASWGRFRTSMQDLARPLLTPGVREAFAGLEARSGKLPALAVARLLANERSLEALIRSDLQQRLMEQVPPLAFPFRTITGLLCLTAKAWDRLILAMGGSLPSLTMAGFTAFRNIREQAEARGLLRDNLKADLALLASREMAEPLDRFSLAVGRVASGEDGGESQGENRRVDFDVEGGEDLAAAWVRTVRDCVERHAVRAAAIQVSAAMVTAVFLFLLAGPLWHVYGQYVPAALASWSGQWDPEALAAYPAMPAGFWFTAFILSILPVLAGALVTVGWALQKARIRRCVSFLREHFPGAAARESSLRITIRDPRIEAARLLLRL